MKIVAIVQARMGSTRLPNKVLKPICGIPMIELLLKRLAKSRELDQIIVATSIDPKNQPLVHCVRSLGFVCEQGSENDVLSRYVNAAEKYNADVVVRITGDCPLIDPVLVDQCINKFLLQGVDYLSNVTPPTYPDGLDVSVVTTVALRTAEIESHDPFHREHVVPYIRESGRYSLASLENSKDLSSLRWTVDEPEDLTVIDNVFKYFWPNIYFTWEDVLNLQQSNPSLFSANSHLSRNQGALLCTGQKLWQRAKKIIPGGNMLLSKRPECFLPGKWPTYFSKSKGCRAWDLDGNEYIDMSIMGIGTNSLGYGHPEVDEAVLRTVKLGNMSTLNCPEEVFLAEKLIELHPWADMARFARSGGEANAIAIRIARAASGRDKVAICGYHGWHDWYLASNLNDDKNLDGHLLPGLKPTGVPRNLTDTVFPFNYNNFDELKKLVELHDIGAIKMEVERNYPPSKNFLQDVRQLANDRNIVLIFDECTSGFRETFGGLHLKYGVEPDMAMFGKALGNGYAISAIIGKASIMQAAQSTFISSTFWTERIGPSAALKTLDIMEREKSWQVITNIGSKITERWQILAQNYDLPISTFGLPALTKFRFESQSNLAYKTLITQEMLKKGIWLVIAFMFVQSIVTKLLMVILKHLNQFSL